jgi:hypothetical protein
VPKLDEDGECTRSDGSVACQFVTIRRRYLSFTCLLRLDPLPNCVPSRYRSQDPVPLWLVIQIQIGISFPAPLATGDRAIPLGTSQAFGVQEEVKWHINSVSELFFH